MIEDKIIERLDKLIGMGNEIVETRNGQWTDMEKCAEWQVSSLSFLNKVFGEKSNHYEAFKLNCDSQHFNKVKFNNSILRSAKDEIESGFLDSLTNLVSASIFSDFLEMAKHLLEQGYKDPAASLIGAVLEDGLRKIATNNEIEFNKRDGLDSLNTKLSKKQIYGDIVFGNIDTWRNIRNSSDHGNFDKYTKEEVNNMLSGVKDFLGRFL